MPETAASFPDLVDTPIRYGDLGPDGLARTVALARWFEDTRISGITGPYNALVADGGYGALRILLATLAVERLAPVPADAAVRVGIGVARVGRTSFTYGYGVFVDDRLVGRGETVTVLADADGPAELPPELRDHLDRKALDGPGTDPAPRPGPARLRRDAYPYAVPVRARLHDVDTNRHVNNVTQLTWYDEAVAGLAAELLGAAWGGPPAALAPWAQRAQYVAEVGYPGEYEVGLAVTSYDDDAVEYALGLFLDGRCVGLADATGGRGALPDASLAALRPPG